MKEHRHAEVLRAIADGREVEILKDGEWIRLEPRYVNPISYSERQWRVKPKPPIVKEMHIFCEDQFVANTYIKPPNIRFIFDPDTKLPIKVELI